jgi:hypothetical protein
VGSTKSGSVRSEGQGSRSRSRWPVWRFSFALLGAALTLSAILSGSALAAKDDTVLASRASTGMKANNAASVASFSADGRFVAFQSQATNLHPDDADGMSDVFVRDLQTQATTLVSRVTGAAGAKGNSASVEPSISGDGRFVAFRSHASNLHADDTDSLADVFVRDLQTNQTTLASRTAGAGGVKGDDHSYVPSISADGLFVAFVSGATNLHPDDTDGVHDVFVRDLQGSATTLVSRTTGGGGAKGNLASFAPSISGDGRLIAFVSAASNLHPDDSDSTPDVFVRDTQSRLPTTTLVSRATGAGGVKGNADSDSAAISADGRFVAFDSGATNLHTDDSDATRDVLVRDLQGSTTTLASRAGASGPLGQGAKGNADSRLPSISRDGRLVAFHSSASNLHADDSDTTTDIFVRDLGARRPTTALASRASGAAGKGNGDSGAASISADGHLVAFHSIASNLHPHDSDTVSDVFVRDLQGNTTTLVSRATGVGGAKGNWDSREASISADGRFVAFTSGATNLHPDDADYNEDIFVRDLQTNTTTLASRATGAAGANGNDNAHEPSISADGRFVAFHSAANNLHPDDADYYEDIFVRDLQTNTTTLVSRAAGAAGPNSNGDSVQSSISGDGRLVAFASGATNLHPDDTDMDSDVFVRDLQANTTILASRSAGPAGVKGNAHSDEASISVDGRFVAFDSNASNLHPDDADTYTDVFVRDLQTDAMTLVSRASGAAGAKGNVSSDSPSVSRDGRFVAFDSFASNLHPDDTDIRDDVFVRSLQTNTTALVSRATGAAGAKGNFHSRYASISANGDFVSFHSSASNLHPDDSDYDDDVFVRNLQANETILASRASGAAGVKGDNTSRFASISADGRFVAFESRATNLHPDDPDNFEDIFVRDVLGVVHPA